MDRTSACITVLEEKSEGQFLSFLRPGADRGSHSNAFLSSLFPRIPRTVDTSEKGERRPCIYCNYCEEVCPVELMPYLLNQYVTHDMLDEAESLGIRACIDCGLCTFVCPSKIPVMTNIQAGKKKLDESSI